MSPSVAEPRRVFPDAVIASVKRNTSIITLFKRYGVTVKPVGSGHMAICPFHKVDGHCESKPSLSVEPDKKVYKCFSCNETGDVISLVMKLDGLDFVRAVEKLLSLCPVPFSSTPPVERPEAPKTENPPQIPEDERQTILREVMRRSTEDLRNNENGRKYLEGRGLDPLRLLDSFSFGFWNGKTFDNLESGEKKKLAAIGLLCGNNGTTRALFENCIVFPLVKDGRIGTIYGRKTLTNGATDGRHYLLPHRREGLFLPEAGLNARRPVIITESIIDGLSLFVAGITNVLPLLGVNGFLPDHLAYLKAQGFPMIHIALNGDDAGNKAAAALKQRLAAEGLTAAVVTLPEGKDLNDMLREMGPEELRAWIAQRTGTEEKDASRPTVWEEGEDINILLSNREYRIRGLNFTGMDRLRGNVRVYKIDAKDLFHVETLDLYLSRSREAFIGQVARTLETPREEITRDVNTLIITLEELRLRKKRIGDAPKVYQMPPQEEALALAYLKSPDLFARIARDFEACGMVGNMNSCLIAFLVAVSRLLEKSLAVLTVARSSAGKSFFQDLVSSFFPPEYVCPITRMTGQNLFYRKNAIKHKLIVFEEDEGMKDALFAIRVLLSSQKLHLQSVKRDEKSGEMREYENVVEGPASVFIATTDQAAINFETSTRFFTLHMDETAQQTKKVLEYMDRLDTEEGLEMKARAKQIARVQQNMQRLLKPMVVVNPIGTGVKYPPEILHSRREKTKLQTLVKASALLHQHQRSVREKEVFGAKVRFIEVAQQDVDIVKEIAREVLQHSLDDLSKLCRELLGHIHEIVEEKYAVAVKDDPDIERWQVAFTRKELKDRSRWSMWHIKEHVRELEDAGYIAPRMGKKGQRYSYSLVEEDVPEMPHLW